MLTFQHYARRENELSKQILQFANTKFVVFIVLHYYIKLKYVIFLIQALCNSIALKLD